MPKKAMESLTESMFYVLMAFLALPMCGIEVTGVHRNPHPGADSDGPYHPVHHSGKV